jgi:pimeloyl-ACP methyl ester carboxylesterase
MPRPERKNDSPSAAPALQTVGTPLVRYGFTSDGTLETRAFGQADEPIAVLVCHGMGQQVRYETISSVAEAIRKEAEAVNGPAHTKPVGVHLSYENGSFLARAELDWTDKEQKKHSVHVYEAYWAPLTQGQVSYWDTIVFLLSAGWNGWKWSKLFRTSNFERWMFEGRKKMRIGPATQAGIIAVLAFLAIQVGIIAYVLAAIAGQYKIVLSQSVPQFGSKGFLWACCKLLAPFLPGIGRLIHAPYFAADWWQRAGLLVLWIALIAEAFFVRYFLIEYVGDVAAYISPYKDSKFDEIRTKIQNIGLGVGKTVYGFGPESPTVPHYQKIVVVGHSLGSVLAYDTLNALMNLDNVSAPHNRREVVERTRALVTFGSPLDKTAFIFRMQTKNDQSWIREQLAASAQPLIVSYGLYRPDSFEWINIWSKADIISGELNYYDDGSKSLNAWPCVQNMIDPKARTPLAAHVEYWNNPLLRETLYNLVVTERTAPAASAPPAP